MIRPLRKHLASVLLAAAVLLALYAVPAAAWAAEVEQPVKITASKTLVNPAYAHTETSATNDAAVAGTGKSYTVDGPQEAAAILRELLLTRTNAAEIQLTVDIPYDANNKAAFWSEVWALEEEIFAEATAHTGDPQEGDYLRYNYHGRKMQAGASTIDEITTLSIAYTFTYHTSLEQEQAVTNAINAFIRESGLAGITDPAADLEKIRTAYDWLCARTTYSDPIEAAPSTDYASYGAVVEGNCVCQGYAVTLYRLLLELGVDCRVISGTDGDGGKHAWNIVKLDGIYYNADATWDDSWQEAGLEYAWFMKSEASFLNHIRNAEFATESFYAAYPMAVATGTCGDGLTWILDSNGLLTVSGEGTMGNFMEDGAPWYDYLDNIKKAEIREGVTNIGGWAFALCKNLEEVAVAATVTAVDESAFRGCSALTAVDLPENLQEIGNGVFYDCSSLAAVAIPDSVTAIGTSAFSQCTSLESIKIPAGVKTVSRHTFSGCHSLESIEIPAGVTGIGDSAFSGCFVLDGVILPEGLTTIGAKLFYGCDTLSSITIPQNVTQIGETAFGSCLGLREIRFQGDAPAIGEDAFAEVTAKAYYPAQNATWTAAVKQGYGGDLTWLQEGLFTLGGTSVSLGDSLDMHFILDPAYVDSDCYAVLTRYYSNGTDESVATVPYSEWNALDDGRLYVTYGDIAAKEMGDYVTVEICDGEGNAISQLYVDSIKSYAMRMLEKEEVVANQELRTLYVDMLNYGAAAQAQFDYNVTMPANDLLTEEQLAYATASYETENHLMAGTGRAGTSLTLKNRITLDFIFKNTAIGTDYTGLYAIAAYTDHYGNEVETRIDTVKAFGDHYGYVSVPGLAVADYAQAVTCTVYDAEGNILAWATDSMEGYAHRMKGNLPEMVEAIIKFGNASYNYFH